MKKTRATSVQNNDVAGLFPHVHLHEKLILTLVCITALAGLVVVLAAFAQPTPAGASNESKQGRVATGRAQPAISNTQGQGVSSADTVSTVSTNGTTVTIPSSTTVPASQPKANVAVEQVVTPTLSQPQKLEKQNVSGSAAGIATDVVNTLQSGLNKGGLLR